MKEYKHLTIEEREKLYRLYLAGNSRRCIAKVMGRSASIICRELNRNNSKCGYLPDTAHNKYIKSKYKQVSKISKNYELKEFIINKLTV